MRTVLLLLATLVACGPKAPPVPQVTLAPQGDSVLVPFAEVTDAAWIDGSRWAVLAPGGPEADLIDLGAGTRRTLTRPGQGQPFNLFRAGDTLYTGEPLARLTALWSLEGAPVRTEPVSDRVRGALPRARDPQGRFLVEMRPPAGADGSGNRDSASVLRVGASVDTVARLAPLDLATIETANGPRFERRVFSGVDRWGVLDDGTTWVARVYHNRVDHRAPDGRETRGQPLPDRVLEVTRADREQFVNKFPEELRRSAEQLPFAPIKAAFTAAFADASGRVWLERSRAVSDTVQSYHVVGRDGRLAFIAVVPWNHQVLAASAGHALVARPGRDGIYLRQAPIPGTP